MSRAVPGKDQSAHALPGGFDYCVAGLAEWGVNVMAGAAFRSQSLAKSGPADQANAQLTHDAERNDPPWRGQRLQLRTVPKKAIISPWGNSPRRSHHDSRHTQPLRSRPQGVRLVFGAGDRPRLARLDCPDVYLRCDARVDGFLRMVVDLQRRGARLSGGAINRMERVRAAHPCRAG